jgi:hypothetical protein
MTVGTLLITLLGVSALTSSILFLPAAIELFHPKDAGPRLISKAMDLSCVAIIANMEEEHPVNGQLAKMFTGYFPAIPSLEH